jgi:hypothetical protein
LPRRQRDRLGSFLFLTGGRARCHTPPDKLDYPKMAATARWLERFVRETCARDEAPIVFSDSGRGEAPTLRSLVSILRALEPVSDEAKLGLEMAEELLAACDDRGRLAKARRNEVGMLLLLLEEKLA